MTYIMTTASIGHTFEIVVDPDDSSYRKVFEMDGDGPDRIVSVKLDGKEV